MPDILAALADTTPTTGDHRCKVGRWLDNIPTSEPGRDELVAAFEAPGRTLNQLAAIAVRLGYPISNKSIAEHRTRVCRCTW